MAASPKRLNVLVVGATGSIGRHVAAQAARHGHAVRALLRDPAKARLLPAGTQVFAGDVTRPDTLAAALDGADAVVLTLGGQNKAGFEAVEYGGVRNLLAVLGPRTLRIALMTTIGVTERVGAYNRRTEAHDWKRRAERLVRASGLPYTIVRPGWFDYNGPDELRPVLLQGDTRHAGDPSDGAVAREQIAEILVRSLTSDAALGKSFELVSAKGAPPDDFDELFRPLDPDTGIDGVRDIGNMPLDEEPKPVRDELAAAAARRSAGT